MMSLVRLTSAALLLFFFTSCGGPAKQIVGKWETTGGSSEQVWEFFPNGTLKEDDAPGRYTLGDNQRIKIQTQSATFVYELEIQGDTMTWTATNGTKMNFSRVK